MKAWHLRSHHSPCMGSSAPLCCAKAGRARRIADKRIGACNKRYEIFDMHNEKRSLLVKARLRHPTYDVSANASREAGSSHTGSRIGQRAYARSKSKQWPMSAHLEDTRRTLRPTTPRTSWKARDKTRPQRRARPSNYILAAILWQNVRELKNNAPHLKITTL